MKKITLFVFIIVLNFVFGAEAADIKVLPLGSDSPIQDLILNPNALLEKDPKTGKTLYVLKGIYFRDSWDLKFNGKRITTDPTGVFLLKIPTGNEHTIVELSAHGPHKQWQTEKFDIIGTDVPLEVTQAPIIAPAPPPVIEEPETVSTPAPILEKKEEPTASLETKTEKTSAVRNSNIQLKSFFVAPLYASQNGGNQKNYSVTAGWSPSIRIREKLGVHANLGAMLFEKSLGGKFLATEASLFGDINAIKSFWLSLGGGLQYWVNYGGTKPEAVGELSYAFQTPLFGSLKLEKVFAAFNWIFDTDRTRQSRAGVSLSF